jgi:hypothetical protein
VRPLLFLFLFACTVVPGGCALGGDGPETALHQVDQSRAERIVLHLDDFGAGWGTEPREEEEGGVANDACFRPSLSGLTLNGDTQSDYFGRDTRFAFAMASVFETPADAQAAFDKLSERDVAECLADSVREGIEGGAEEQNEEATTRTTSLDELELGSFGERSIAYRARIEIMTGGATVPTVVDVGLVQRERALALVGYASLFKAFPRDEEVSLTQALASRMDP